MTNYCDTCEAKGNCPFYEAGTDECVYDVLAETAKKTSEKNTKKA